MLSLLPMVLVAAVAGQPATVSFTCRAEPMGQVVQGLGKATELALSVTKQCANDILVIDAKNVTVPRLLAEIAKVDAGTWVPAAGGFMFTPDRVARNEEARAELARRAAQIQTCLSNALKSLREADDDRRKQKEADKAAKARERAAGTAPPRIPGFIDLGDVDDTDVTWEDIDVLEALAGVDPNQLVLRPYQKVALSTEPNSMQSALSSRANRILAQLVQKHDVAAERFIVQMRAEFQQGKHPSEDAPQIGLPTDSAILAGYGKADLTIETSADTSQLTLGLRFYDQRGKSILETSSTLQQIYEGESGADAGGSNNTRPKTPVRHSDMSAKILAFPTELEDAEKLGSGYRRAADVRAAEQILLDPEHNDPLSFAVTDKIIALSESLGKPLVAVVPDDALTNLSQAAQGDDSVEEFVSELGHGYTMSKFESDGWLEIKPNAPDTARKLRLDRAALGKFIRAAQAKGVPSLDDIAAYALNAPSPTTEGVSSEYLALFAPSLMRPEDEPGSWSMYRIYGELSSDAKQQLASGLRLPVSVLGVSQRLDLAEIVYGARPQLSPPPDRSNVITWRTEQSAPEPTEMLPDGIPDRSFFQLFISEEPCLEPVNSVAEILSVYDVESISEVDAGTVNRRVQAGESDSSPPIDEFRVGSRYDYTLNFLLAGGIGLQRTLTDNRVRKDAEVVSLENLPADIKTMLDEKASQENREPARPARVQSGPPPHR